MRPTRYAAVVVTLALGAIAAHAQAGQTLPGGEGQLATTAAEELLERGARGKLSGTVISVDYGAGTLQLEVGEEVVGLRGRPADLALISPGEEAEVRWRAYGDELWLEPSADRVTGRIFAPLERHTGRVLFVDEERGLLQLQDRVLRAHPVQLSALRPGQLVSLAYADVEGADWVEELGSREPDDDELGLPDPVSLEEPPEWGGEGGLDDVEAEGVGPTMNEP